MSAMERASIRGTTNATQRLNGKLGLVRRRRRFLWPVADVLFLPDNRQLNHAGTLSFRHCGYKHGASVWKLESIAVLLQSAWLDFAKAGNAKARVPGREPPEAVFDLSLEGKLGPGQEAYSDTRLVLRGKATC